VVEEGILFFGRVCLYYEKLMKKTYLFFVAALCALLVMSYLAGCGGDDRAPASRKWTIIMYWDGDDINIQSDLLNAFEKMATAKVGSSDEVNIVIQFDRFPGSTAYGGWSITHRFFLTPGMEPTEVNAICDWGDGQGGREVDMSDPDTLRDFITWSVKNYPAERYALIVADHGFGWQGIAIDNTDFMRTMSVKHLRQAIEESQVHFDLLSLDACTMQMIEVADELRYTGADVLVGTENTGATWPYAEILQAVIQDPGMSAEAIGRIMVDQYLSSHQGETGLTLSVLKLSNLEAVTAAVTEMSAAILNDSSVQVLQDKAQVVMEKVRNAVVYSGTSPDWADAGGVSVYFPTAGPFLSIPIELQYFYKDETVSFAGDTSWHDVLTSCYSTREPSQSISAILDARRDIRTFDDDKVDLIDLCSRIVNYSPPEL